jgi:hypothetical protein
VATYALIDYIMFFNKLDYIFQCYYYADNNNNNNNFCHQIQKNYNHLIN